MRIQWLHIVLGLGLIAPLAGADVWDDLAQYKMDGEPDAPPVKVEALLRSTPSEEMGAVEGKLIAIVASTNSTDAAKWFSCRMLQRVGTEDCVPVLATLLGDDTLSHYARLTLEHLTESQAAEKALLEALQSAADPLKIGIIGSLAARGDEQAVSAIATFTQSTNAALSKAAIAALGRIGGKTAAAAIAKALPGKTPENVEREVRVAQQDSLLLTADHMRVEDVQQLMSDGTHPGVRTGAFKILAKKDAGRALQALMAALPERAGLERASLIRAAMDTGDAAVLDRLVADLKGATLDDQRVLLAAIDELDLKHCETDVIDLLSGSDEKLREAAIYVLANIGGDASFEPLYKEYQRSAAPAVTFAISRLPVPAIDAKLLRTLSDSDAGMDKRLATLPPLVLRTPAGAVELMNRLAAPGQPDELRRALYKALESMGDYETCKMFAAAVMTDDTWRKPAQQSLKRLCLQMDKGDEIWRAAFKPALDTAPDDASREALLAIADGAAGREALRYLETVLKDPEHSLHDAARRSLVRWPHFDAGDAWLRILAAGAADTEDVAAAQRGIVRALSRGEIQARDDAKLQLAVKAIQQAPNTAFKQAIIDCYSKPSDRLRKQMRERFKPIQDDPDIGEQVQTLIK
jgi:HEAT repeat protein